MFEKKNYSLRTESVSGGSLRNFMFYFKYWKLSLIHYISYLKFSKSLSFAYLIYDEYIGKSKYQQTKSYASTILNILVKVLEYLVTYFERVWIIVKKLFSVYECVLYETVLNQNTRIFENLSVKQVCRVILNLAVSESFK